MPELTMRASGAAVFIAPAGTPLRARFWLPTRRTPTTRGRDKRRRMATFFNPHRVPKRWRRIGYVTNITLGADHA